MTLTAPERAALMALPDKGSMAYGHTAAEDGIVHAGLAHLAPSRCGFYIKISATPAGAALKAKIKENGNVNHR